MAREVKQIIAPQFLGAGVSTLYQTPNNRDTVITRITFTNTSAGDLFVNLYLVPEGGSATDENQIVDEQFVASGETFSASDVEGQVLPANNTIQGNAEAGGVVNIIGSGTEITRGT